MDIEMWRTLFLVVWAFWILLWGWEIYSNRQARKKMADDISVRLNRRVVIIEGRCAKCGERVADDVLEEKGLVGKPLSSIKSQGVH